MNLPVLLYAFQFSQKMVKELAITIIRERGLYVTYPRIAILSLLISGRKVVNVQDILKAVGAKFDRITVYRTLSFFCDKGLFYKILDNHNKAYYALDSGLTTASGTCSEHFHFKCLTCGTVECLPIPYQNNELPDGFVKTGANLLIMGHCPQCSSQHPDLIISERPKTAHEN